MIGLFALAAVAGSEPVALEAMQRFGSCVVANSPKRASYVLEEDFRTETYQRRLRSLLDDNRRCIGRGSIGSNQVLFAGSLAEALLKSGKRGAGTMVITQAGQAQPAPRGPLEAMALCTVAAAPQQSAALLATRPGSPEEKSALEPLVPQMTTCAPENLQLTANPSSLRALIALAAWRITSTSRASAS